jgi:hypothetical protein
MLLSNLDLQEGSEVCPKDTEMTIVIQLAANKLNTRGVHKCSKQV